MDTFLQRAGVTEDIGNFAQIFFLVHDWEVVEVLDDDIESPALNLLRWGWEVGGCVILRMRS